MFTSSFLKDAAERSFKSFCQVILSVLALNGANVLTLDWQQYLGLAVTAAVVSLLTSVVSAGVGSTGTASLTNAVVPNPAPDA